MILLAVLGATGAGCVDSSELPAGRKGCLAASSERPVEPGYMIDLRSVFDGIEQASP